MSEARGLARCARVIGAVGGAIAVTAVVAAGPSQAAFWTTTPTLAANTRLVSDITDPVNDAVIAALTACAQGLDCAPGLVPDVKVDGAALPPSVVASGMLAVHTSWLYAGGSGSFDNSNVAIRARAAAIAAFWALVGNDAKQQADLLVSQDEAEALAKTSRPARAPSAEMVAAARVQLAQRRLTKRILAGKTGTSASTAVRNWFEARVIRIGVVGIPRTLVVRNFDATLVLGGM